MKTLKLIALSIITLFASQMVSAQTADEIAGKYIDAIGGKDQISKINTLYMDCLLYTSPSPRDGLLSRMPSSA